MQVDALETIHSVAKAFQTVDEDQAIGEIADYIAKTKLFSKPFIWTAAEKTCPSSWWTGICFSTDISKIAASILNLPPTSAAVERSFSKHSWIHSKKRNRLTAERAAKLVFIAYNLQIKQNEDESLPQAYGTFGEMSQKISSSEFSKGASLLTSTSDDENEESLKDLLLSSEESNKSFSFSSNTESEDSIHMLE